MLISLLLSLISSSLSLAALLGVQPNSLMHPNNAGEYEICWFGAENSETLSTRLEIQAHLYKEITVNAGLPLHFYKDCFEAKNPFFPIAIAFYDAVDNQEGLTGQIKSLTANSPYPGHPTTYSRGKWINENLLDIVLTFHFQEVDSNLVEQSKNLSAQGKLNLMKSIALHEVLHAFGFKHEQDRPDSICKTGRGNYNKKIHTLIGDYDAKSIMNTCNTHQFNFEKSAMGLSPGDQAALDFIYLHK